MNGEVWKEVPGYEGVYQISNLGRVKHLEEKQIRSNGRVLCEFTIPERILKPYRTGKRDGYMTVSIRKKNLKVHRLVAEAFCPNPECKPEVNHIDGDKSNNAANNLEWVTTLENSQHAWKNHLVPAGENRCGSKLTQDDVDKIRKIYRRGDKEFGAKPLARRYGISCTTLRNIIKRKKWRYEG